MPAITPRWNLNHPLWNLCRRKLRNPLRLLVLVTMVRRLVMIVIKIIRRFKIFNKQRINPEHFYIFYILKLYICILYLQTQKKYHKMSLEIQVMLYACLMPTKWSGKAKLQIMAIPIKMTKVQVERAQIYFSCFSHRRFFKHIMPTSNPEMAPLIWAA